ncbi:MAG TPA: hypothetical protein VNJ47_13480 [Nevskiales bacterium]|nr:hypothetical protein [Nevskiales bacterium]
MHTSESACHRRRPLRTPKTLTALLLGLLAAATGGCAGLAPATPRASVAPAWTETEFRPVSEYLAYMHMLAVAPPATRKSLYQQAVRSQREQATPHTKLRLALALATLDSPYGDVNKARQLYRELLPSAQSMPEIESLLQVQLAEAQQRLALEERLALMQQRLDKAEAKIQALTTIEQTLDPPAPAPENRPRSAP